MEPFWALTAATLSLSHTRQVLYSAHSLIPCAVLCCAVVMLLCYVPILPNQGLDEVSIATVMKYVLLGLEYVHKNGGIHRDVKV